MNISGILNNLNTLRRRAAQRHRFSRFFSMAIRSDLSELRQSPLICPVAAPKPISMTHLIILISGGGSNMRAIVEAARSENWAASLGARVTAVISNRPGAGGLAWAQSRGIPTQVVDHRLFASRDAFDEALALAIRNGVPSAESDQPVVVVLAGFMRILTPGFVQQFDGRMLNIHPSLLPAFPGLHTHQRALEAGCQTAGATVHLVTAELDHGPLLAQAEVPVLPGDTADTLAARVLAQEHILYPRAIRQFLEDEIRKLGISVQKSEHSVHG
jgi:phosphoribosylglycinamide formyltransferase 1